MVCGTLFEFFGVKSFKCCYALNDLVVNSVDSVRIVERVQEYE